MMNASATARRLRARLVSNRILCAGLGVSLLLSLSACWGGGDDDTSSSGAADRVVFEAPEFVTQARVLDGDPTSGRCPDASQPCFKDDKDILKGQRTIAGIHDVQVVFLSTTEQDQVVGDREITRTLNGDVIVTLKSTDSKFKSYELSQATEPNQYRTFLGLTAVGAQFGGLAQSLVRFQLYGADPLIPTDDHGVSVLSGTVNVGLLWPGSQPSSSAMLAATGDFDGTGVERVVYVAGDRIGVVQPVLQSGALTDISMGVPLSIGRTSSLTTANFFADTGPVAVAAVTGTALQVQFFSVNPNSNAIGFMGDKTLMVTLKDNHYVVPHSARLVAGKFTDPSYDQLVLAFDESDSAGKPLGVTLWLIDRDINGMPRATPHSAVLPAPAGTVEEDQKLWLAKGRFLTGDAFEGAVIAKQTGAGSTLRLDVSLVGVGSGGTFEKKAGANDTRAICNFGLATGNFDRKVTRDDGTQLANRNMQIALLRGLSCAGGDTNQIEMATWQVSPPDGGAGPPVLSSLGDTDSVVIPTNNNIVPIPDPIMGLAMVVLDVQGRSMVLGPPKIVTIENLSQPSVVVAAPPMHADWIGGKLVNYSAAPDGFFSKYTTSDSTEAEGSTKSTTTWSFSAEEKLGFKGTAGNCEAGPCLSVGATVSAKQDLDGSTAALRGRFSTQELEISQQTAFQDIVWYKDSALTIYVYPVIGKTTCPAGKPNCSQAERVPVTLLVAGPDTVNQTSASAEVLPWYQPPWVPGNVLSYPATLGQLKTAALVDPTQFKSLTDVRRWALDATEVEQKATWSSGSQSGDSVTSNGNFSGNATLSFYAKDGIGAFGTGELSFDFSVGGSRGFKNLTESKTTVTKATGLTFTKTALFDDVVQYSYWLTPYIFAQNIPPTATSADDTFDGFGALQSGFVVDVLALGAGPLWRNEYNSAPDLALLHPSRLSISVTTTDRKDGTCIFPVPTGSAFDCVDVAEPRPERPGDDAYHWMRGFFISDAEAPGQGPLKTSATAGDKLALQARVHNLSLAPMPAGTAVKARFYGMVWDPGSNVPVGPSFLVGTDSRGAVLPYHTTDDTPNWALLSVPFDTTPYAGKDLRFWVVTWMEDANGNMVAERTDRGLTAIPPTNADFAAVAALEAPYGNNVGFFDMPFHVFEPTTPSATATARTATKPSLTMTQVGSEARSLAQGKSTMVATRVQVGEHDLPNGVKVRFYDADPGAGGKMIGERMQPRMRAGATHDFRVPFRPRVCGTHRVHVVVGPGTRFEHSARLQPIEVSCS